MMKRTILSLSLVVGLAYAPQAQVMMIGPADSLSYISSPLDLDSLFYWFAADVGVTDSLGGAIATDEGVGTWNDLSGNGYHVTQTTNGARPVYKATGGPGSKPTIQFDGTDDFLASAAHWWGSDDITVFVVMKFTNATRNAFDVVISRNKPSTSERQWQFFGYNNSGPSTSPYNISLQQSSLGTAGDAILQGPDKSVTWRSIVFVSDGTASGTNGRVYQDGADVTDVNATDPILDSANPSLYFGANQASPLNNFGQFSISEAIVYSRALTATERAAIENYLNKKYDLY